MRVDKLLESVKQVNKEDLKYEYHEREIKDQNNAMTMCIIAECLISSTAMNGKMKCKGIL